MPLKKKPARGRARARNPTPVPDPDVEVMEVPTEEAAERVVEDPVEDQGDDVAPAEEVVVVPTEEGEIAPVDENADALVAEVAEVLDEEAVEVSEKRKKKRAKKTVYGLTAPEEETMLEFLHGNPILWNVKLTEYRRVDKKAKLWEDQGKLMGKSSEHLQGWFKSLRDTHTRLDKNKSGDGTPEFTEREVWIKSRFGFLKTVTRHRPEPCSSVKATIEAHAGDLAAAEAACAEQNIVLADDNDDITPSPFCIHGPQRQVAT